MILGGCSREDHTYDLQFTEGVTETTEADIMVLGHGDIVVRLYPDCAPEACASLKLLSESGYYGNINIDNIIKDYCFRINGRTTGVKEDTFRVTSGIGDNGLHPYYGALCITYTDEKRLDASDLVIITSDHEDLALLEDLLYSRDTDLRDYLLAGYGVELTEEQLDAYRRYGGAPWLEGHCIVLGQVVEGLDLLESIGETKVDGSSYEPEEPVVVRSITLK